MVHKETNTVPKDLCTVIVILHRVLYEAEAVDVADVRVTVGPEKIKPTDSLLWSEGNIRTASVMHINNKEPEVEVVCLP